MPFFEQTCCLLGGRSGLMGNGCSPGFGNLAFPRRDGRGPKLGGGKIRRGTAESRSKAKDEPFFSFTYNGRPSAELLKTWTFQRTRRPLEWNKDPALAHLSGSENRDWCCAARASSTETFQPWNGRSSSEMRATRIRRSWRTSALDITVAGAATRDRASSRRSSDSTTTSAVLVPWKITDRWRRSSHGGRQSVLRLPADGRPTATCRISTCSGPARRG